MDSLVIIRHFYPEDTPLRRLLLKHSTQVRDKAMEILAMSANDSLKLDRETVEKGAMLHDLGVGRCHAPSILCEGTEHYLRHGLIGGQMLREFGNKHSIDLEIYARICERHTGAGLTAKEITMQNLPLPHQDFLPETPEEKLICLADKFFSKSGNMCEKSIEQVWTSLDKFGQDVAMRLHNLFAMFHLTI
ncbi:MAG: HD domain-containing protein [Victivallales bacterium]|nr:HD domain-containing protein [Victivallales bacterium]